MGVKEYRPITATRRYYTVSDFAEITRDEPLKSLTSWRPSGTGRNCYGRVTVRRRGGGHKKRWRDIDFKRDKNGIPATVESIEYDPNRSARIALLSYKDGEKRYILAPKDLKVEQVVESGDNVDIKVGNVLPLSNIPLGTQIHNIELRKGMGGKLVRSAGSSASLLAKDGLYAQVRMPSGEVRLIHRDCRATIGQISNQDHVLISVGKAGRSRWLGKRPRVRGVAMNPVDHPMGGGEGKTSGGRHPCSPSGIPAKGYKTKRNISKYIVKRRSK